MEAALASDVTKTSDAVNNTAASTNPLEVPLEPGTYRVQSELFYNSNTTADFAARLYAIGGATSLANVVGEGIVNNDGEGISGQMSRFTGLATNVAVSGTSGQDANLSFRGVITVDTSTTLTVRWAQRVSDPSDTTLRAGSYLKATPV